jgi:hypothetical protein
MVPTVALWLPILVSAVLAFLVSFVFHMVLPLHRNDFKKLPAEDEVMDALRRFNIPPGDYMMPCAGSPEAMRGAEFKARFAKGPVAMMTFYPAGRMGMGASLVQWFGYTLLVGLFVAYVCHRAFVPGEPYLKVFRVAAVTAFMGYGLALMQNSIWYKRDWGSTLRSLFDSLVYGLVTAGTFGWLWPK